VLQKLQKKNIPYAWKPGVVQVLTWLAGLCELFDFAPFWDLLDGHAIWHGLTIGIGFFMWGFILEDSVWHYEKIRKEKIL